MDEAPKVLIVDDEPRNVKLLQAMLKSRSYRTSCAYGGEEALQKVTEEAPDLILLDVMMPRITGFEVTRRLKNNPLTQAIPIILVTALDGIDNKIEGLEAGADEFINKPVNQAELLARVKSLTRLKQYQDNLKANTTSANSLAFAKEKGGFFHSEIDLPTILLVEDDEKDAKLIENSLSGEPYHIKLARTGEETISRAQQERIDVILLDILLPGIDGFQVCQRLKNTEQTRNTQIIAITSLSDIQSKVKGIELGADEFLVKPINRQELKARIRSLVRKKAYVDNLENGYEMAVRCAITDKLTGLYNYGYFKHLLDQELKRSSRQNTPLALMMIDVDDFKYYNDHYGHLTGDDILKTIAGSIKNNLREIDLLARYGGEEFAVILPGTQTMDAFHVAERVRNVISTQEFAGLASPPSKNTSLSIGIASFPTHTQSAVELIDKADRALYTAKQKGKNTTVIYGEISNQPRSED